MLARTVVTGRKENASLTVQGSTSMSSYVTLDEMKLTEDERNYFESCARIRDVSRTYLIRRLIQIMCRDQLIEAVLDDDGKTPRGNQKGFYRKERTGAVS